MCMIYDIKKCLEETISKNKKDFYNKNLELLLKEITIRNNSNNLMPNMQTTDGPAEIGTSVTMQKFQLLAIARNF